MATRGGLPLRIPTAGDVLAQGDVKWAVQGFNPKNNHISIAQKGTLVIEVPIPKKYTLLPPKEAAEWRRKNNL